VAARQQIHPDQREGIEQPAAEREIEAGMVEQGGGWDVEPAAHRRTVGPHAEQASFRRQNADFQESQSVVDKGQQVEFDPFRLPVLKA